MPEIDAWIKTIDPTTLDFVKAVGPSLIAFIALIIASFIQINQVLAANAQAKTAKNKLRLDLQPSRIEVREKLAELMGHVQENSFTQTQLFVFYDIQRRFALLFAKDVVRYLEREYEPRLKKLAELRAERYGQDTPMERRAELVKPIDEIRNWFYENEDVIDVYMEPHMRINA